MDTHTEQSQAPDSVKDLPANDHDNPYVQTADAWRPASVADMDSERRAREAMTELGTLTSELAPLEGIVSRAAITGDVDRLCDAAESLLALHVKFAELYRSFLVIRIKGTRTRMRTGVERSSW